MTTNPDLTPIRQPEDPDAALRPKSLGEFVGWLGCALAARSAEIGQQGGIA